MNAAHLYGRAMTAEEAQRIVKNCLRGRSMPRSLEVLWKCQQEGDAALASMFRIESLLNDLAPLDDGYGDAIARESADIAANVAAHRKIFEQLGFFAAVEDGAFLAYWLEDPAPEPAVVKLDSEGQYGWAGQNAAEALFRLAEDRDAAGARAWLQKQGLDLAELGELGSATQFLPKLGDAHERIYYTNLGEPRPAREMAAVPADPGDPTTWLLRPGAEVKEALIRILGAPPMEYCVWCDGAGLVTQVKLSAKTNTQPVLGVAIGSSKVEVEQILGPPAKTGINWIRYNRGDRAFRFGMDKAGIVNSLILMLNEKSA